MSVNKLQNFNGYPTGIIPSGTVKFESSALAVTYNANIYEGDGSFRITTSSSAGVGRLWNSGVLIQDGVVSSYVYVQGINAKIGVFARGSSTDTSSPTYYLATISKTNPSFELDSYTNGTKTVVKTVNSITSITNPTWFRLSLYCNNSGINVEAINIMPGDANYGKYINSGGAYQSAKTNVISIYDTSITQSGLAGIYCNSSANTYDFDYFAAVDTNNTNTVSITSPSNGASLSGWITISASTPYADVERVDFYTDNVLRRSEFGAPFSFVDCTEKWAQGAHTISAVSYDSIGNTGINNISVTTNNSIYPIFPSVYQKLPSTRTFCLLYSTNPMPSGTLSKITSPTDAVGYLEDRLFDDDANGGMDIGIVEHRYYQHFATFTSTPRIMYTNISNLYSEILLDYLKYASDRGLDREGAFFHVSAAKSYTGAAGTSAYASRNFWCTMYESGVTQRDFTGNVQTGTGANLRFDASGTSVYLGYPEKYREIIINTNTGGTGYSYALEYATSVDANYVPSHWSGIPIISDTTNSFSHSGVISFDPPSGWAICLPNGASIGNSTVEYPIFFTRIRSVGTGIAPIVSTILSNDFLKAGTSLTAGTIPAFDYAADLDGDNYLNDTEYASRAAGKDARFAYQGRLVHTGYGSFRLNTNPANGLFTSWVINYHSGLLQYPDNALASGFFLDNSQGRRPTALVGGATLLTSESGWNDNFADNLGRLSAQLAINIYPRICAVNTDGSETTPSGTNSGDVVASYVPLAFEEFFLRALTHTTTQFNTSAALVKSRLNNSCVPMTNMIMDTFDTIATSGSVVPNLSARTLQINRNDNRLGVSTLAYYYLLSQPSTYICFFGGRDPGSPFDPAYTGVLSGNSLPGHWYDATRRDIGQAAGRDYFLFASGMDPAAGTTQYGGLTYPSVGYSIFARDYANALVLYKPVADNGTSSVFGDAQDYTSTTHALSGTFIPLLADNTLGSPITSISLRNGEGAVLLRGSGVPSVPGPYKPSHFRHIKISNKFLLLSY